MTRATHVRTAAKAVIIQPGLGNEPDTRQVGVAWLPLADLADQPFCPQALKPLLQGLAEGTPAIYLGDIN